jgi:porphobilinogen synthase
LPKAKTYKSKFHPCQEFSPFYRFDGKEVQELFDLGIRAVNIYVKVDENLKTTVLKPGTKRTHAKPFVPSKPLVRNDCHADVALDPYSIYGHDGIIANGDVENDSTNDALVKWLFLMHKGADFVAPSDMMDGRVLRLRQGLDAAGFHNVGIMSYSAKYASAFYGPFRDARLCPKKQM